MNHQLIDHQPHSYDTGHGYQQPRGQMTTNYDYEPVVIHMIPGAVAKERGNG